MAEVKPCPFCGRAPTVDDCGNHRYFVRCKCGIAQDKLYMQKCDAVRRWNTRKTLSAAQPEIVHCKDCKFSDEFDGDVWLCRRRKESSRVLAIDTCKVAKRKR